MPVADIAIVIVSYNVRHFLAQCLSSVRRADKTGFTVAVYVVDNASVDGSVAMVQAEFPEVSLITNATNVGFSAANNQVLREVRSTYVLLLNPDTLLSEDTLQVTWQCMESHPSAGAMGVRMIDGSGTFLPESKRQLPGLWNSFCKLFLLSDLFPSSRWFSGYNLGFLPEDKSARIEVLCGAYMCIRQDVLDEVGLLDEAFFMYGEDIDLSYRILKAGYEVWYVPETTIIHYKGESTKKSSLNYVRTFYGAMHTYVKKHYGSSSGAGIARMIHLAVTVRAVLSGARRLAATWLLPLLDAMLIGLALLGISRLWAEYYFNDPAYYRTGTHTTLVAVYATVWVFCLWLAGQYHEKVTPVRRLGFVLLGTAGILLVYSLLPEQYRSSRAIILLGTPVTWLISALSAGLFTLLTGARLSTAAERRVAVVGGKENALRLSALLRSSGVADDQLYYISPAEGETDMFFSNTLSQLPAVVRALGITEVVYSSESLSFVRIMESMTALHPGLVFRIGGDDSLGIIGNSARSRPGEWTGLEVRYRLDLPLSRRLKRCVDVSMAAVCLALFPILFFWSGARMSFFFNVIRVFLGKDTWVGYGGKSEDYTFLPSLPPAVVKVPFAGRIVYLDKGSTRLSNLTYARDYQPWRDVVFIWQNLHQLGNRLT